jgi:hypothetical protein
MPIAKTNMLPLFELSHILQLITTPKRKLLAKKYCRKADPNSRTLQSTFLQLKKSGLLIEVSKEKHTTRYVVPLIAATRSFTESYIELQVIT